MKDLIVYYSFEGNTKKAAEQIAKAMDADILELETIKQLPKNNAKFFVGGAMAAFEINAKLKNLGKNLNEYNRIIIGTPIWAGKCAPAINTFLKKCGYPEKIHAVFTLSGGGDNEKCLQQINKKLTNLKCTVALADENNPKSKENEVKINRFVESLNECI